MKVFFFYENHIRTTVENANEIFWCGRLNKEFIFFQVIPQHYVKLTWCAMRMTPDFEKTLAHSPGGVLWLFCMTCCEVLEVGIQEVVMSSKWRLSWALSRHVVSFGRFTYLLYYETLFSSNKRTSKCVYSGYAHFSWEIMGQ